MPIRFSIKNNVAETTRKLRQLCGQQNRDLMQEVDITMLNVLRDSKTKPPRVPVDTGALQSTGFTEPAKLDKGKIVAAVGYGGIASRNVSAGSTSTVLQKLVDYAVYVHENLSGRIKNYKRPGSGAKFVETHWKQRLAKFRADGETVIGKSWRKL